MEKVTVSAPKDIDRLGWERLYDKYRRDHGLEPDPKVAQTVWTWINGQGKTVEGCVARAGDGHIVGFVHFREVPRPLYGGTGGYIDDLFVDEGYRGMGIAEKLVQGVSGVGRSRSWSDVCWAAPSENAGAQQAYEGFAEKTSLVSYKVTP